LSVAAIDGGYQLFELLLGQALRDGKRQPALVDPFLSLAVSMCTAPGTYVALIGSGS
jgi:hypothetical protein